MLAYSLEKFEPAALPVAQFLAPIAWGLLMVSIAGGLAHLEATVTVLRLGAQEMDIGALRLQMRRALANPTIGGVADVGTGELMTREQASNRAAMYDAVLAESERRVKRIQRSAQWAYHARNAGLLRGFGALALWKIINAFLGSP